MSSENCQEALDAFSLRGQVALVTGGGTGLGFAIASAMLRAGAHVVITGRREETLKKAVVELGANASWHVHDVTESSAADELVARVEREVGRPTILVNNAGIHLKKHAAETTVKEFRSVVDTHVIGAFGMVRAVLPGMTSKGKGSILFLASMTSLFGLPKVVAYSAAKSAYVGMVRSLATEVGASGVRVNAIAPGFIETPMLYKALEGDAERKSRIIARTPMGCFGRPCDVGWAAVYLCSDAAAFVTGVVLPVDGGASIGF